MGLDKGSLSTQARTTGTACTLPGGCQSHQWLSICQTDLVSRDQRRPASRLPAQGQVALFPQCDWRCPEAHPKHEVVSAPPAFVNSILQSRKAANLDQSHHPTEKIPHENPLLRKDFIFIYGSIAD